MMLARLLNASLQIQRMVAIAGLALFVVLAGGVAWLAKSTIDNQQMALLEQRERAGKLTAVANMKDNLNAISPVDATGDGQQLFLEAESLTIGRANLQSGIDAIAQSNNVIVASAGSVPDIDEKGITLIGIRVDVSGSYEAIQKALVDIETSKPPLLVRELSVRLSSGEAGDRPIEMAAQIKIFGAFRLTAQSGATGPAKQSVTP
jgi:Type II secretion system (T2SS), protein M subtype b